MKEYKVTISDNGIERWYNENNQLHRENGPAVIWPNNYCEKWYKNGELHREDGPAIIWPNACEQWYKNDQLHREDGPAVVYLKDCKNIYYIHGNIISANNEEEFNEIKKAIEIIKKRNCLKEVLNVLNTKQ